MISCHWWYGKGRENQQLRRQDYASALPNKPEYVSLVRLAASGIAGRMGFDVETVEDIKLAVAEACTNAIKHGTAKYSEYRIEFGVEEKCLTISASGQKLRD